MDASIVDLRYKMKDVLKAINRNEKVRILYHGKIKGEIVPAKSNRHLKTDGHPLFNMLKNGSDTPVEIVAKMRRSRQDGV